MMSHDKCSDAEADRFLREGLPHFVPAVRALSSFVHEIEGRIRKVLKPYDHELSALGLASSISKLSFSPNLGGELPEQVIEIGVKNPDRAGFYILIDLSETPSLSLYVGFWLWTPVSQNRKQLFGALRPVWDVDGYETEQGDYETLYVGRYVNQEQYFPNFETLLDKLVQHVIWGLRSIDFAERFGPGFRKTRAQGTRDKGASQPQ
jgi:hypothetical protein